MPPAAGSIAKPTLLLLLGFLPPQKLRARSLSLAVARMEGTEGYKSEAED